MSQNGHNVGYSQRPKDYQPGYSPALVRTDIKDKLREFRMQFFGTDSHVERCLITAALNVMLHHDEFRDVWLAAFKDACRADIDLSMPALPNRAR